MNKWKVIDLIALAFMTSWVLFIVIFGAEHTIAVLGVSGYLLVFLTSFLGGIVTITVVTVYPAILVFANYGLNPFLIGFFAGIGLTFSNIFYYFIGVKGRDVAQSSKLNKTGKDILKWINKQPKWVLPAFILLYVGFSPFPNNLLTASGGVISIRLKKLFVPLFIGNIILMTAIAFAASI